MIDDTSETPPAGEKFDASSFPEDTLFHERRRGIERRGKFPPKSDAPDPAPPAPKERRARKERRRRIDPTTFEKQYTVDELEFMNAMQQFKVQACKSFPTHSDVLHVAYSLGYRKIVGHCDSDCDSAADVGPQNGSVDEHEQASKSAPAERVDGEKPRSRRPHA